MIDPDTLTDEECLSIKGPYYAIVCPPDKFAVRDKKQVVARCDTASDAMAEADRRNAAHVRERLRELMGRG